MLKGRTAVITGAGRGIGKAIALKFAQNGANIALIVRDTAKTESVVKETESFGVTARAYACDVSDFEAVKETAASIAKDFGGIDILINNAGITKDGLLLTMTESSFDEVISVNLKGVFNLSKTMSRYIIKSEHGRIINISSVIGLMGNAGQTNYAASKAGVIGFSKSLAKELAGRGVTVNCICPGFIETDMTGQLTDEQRAQILSQVPLKRIGLSSEVAELALFLACDGAAYITGECIKQDGGLYI